MAARSGVEASDEIIKAWEAVKKDKSKKFIIFKISDNKKNIEIANEDDGSTGDSENIFDHFLSLLPEKACRYALYKCQFKLEGGYGLSVRDKNIMLSWAPEVAPVGFKMVHASSKSSLMEALGQIDREISADRESEIQREVWVENLGSMGTMKMTGTIVEFEGEEC